MKHKMNNIKCGLLPFVVATSVLLSNEIYARTENAAYVLKEVTVVGTTEPTTSTAYKVDKMSSHKYNQPLLKTPKTISIISESALDDRGATSLEEGLRGISGITFAAGEGGTPPGDNARIRGFSAAQDIFVDGIRDIAGYKRHIYNTEAIEVTKGPGSSVSGRGSTGGSINMRSKRAQLESASKATVKLGTKNNRMITLDTNKLIDDTSAIRINALSEKGDVAGRNEVNNAMNAIAVSYTRGISTDSRLTLAAEYQKQDNLPDYGLPWVRDDYKNPKRYTVVGTALEPYKGGTPPVSFNNFYGNVHRDFEKIEATKFTGVFEKDLSKDSSLFIQMRQGKVKRKSVVTAPRFYYDAAEKKVEEKVKLNDQKARDIETTLLALQMAYIAKVNKHNFSVGTEFSIEKEKRWHFDHNCTDNLGLKGLEEEKCPGPVITNDLHNPDPYKAYSGTYTRGVMEQTGEGKSLALYAFDTYTLNKKWDLNAGIRYEKYKTTTKDYDESKTYRHSDNMLSWNAGIVRNIQENGTAYFSVGKSFNPIAEDLTARTYNIDLDPEESLSYELGTKWELFDDLLVSAAIFRTEKNNARSDDPLAVNDRAEVLEGKQRVDGLELSAVGQLTPKLELMAGYTYQKGKVVKATGDDVSHIGRTLARTPKHLFSVWANFKPTDDVTAGIGLQYVDKQYNGTYDNRATAPSYTTVDMAFSQRIKPDLSLQFNAKNITNKRYVGTVGGGHFVPGAGRSLSLTMNYEF